MLRSSLTLLVIASVWCIWEASQRSETVTPLGLFVGAALGAGASLILDALRSIYGRLNQSAFEGAPARFRNDVGTDECDTVAVADVSKPG